MTLQERISQWVDAHEAELIRDIGRLVAVKSVRGEPEPDAPFGPGPRAALDEALPSALNTALRPRSTAGPSARRI